MWRTWELGIGWRHPHYAELLERLPALDFLEVHSENFFAPGGASLAVLEQGRAHYPISLHGVGLSLGSAAGLDDWHLDQLQRLVQHIDPVRVSDHASFARGVFRRPVAESTDRWFGSLCCAPMSAGFKTVCNDGSWWKTCQPICAGPCPTRNAFGRRPNS
jgi:hypothetical protein